MCGCRCEEYRVHVEEDHPTTVNRSGVEGTLPCMWLTIVCLPKGVLAVNKADSTVGYEHKGYDCKCGFHHAVLPRNEHE